jgi:uncharacterized protein (TIGR03067 family)
MRRFCLLAMIPLALLGAAPGEDDEKERKALQGVWTLVELTESGKNTAEDKKPMEVIFRGKGVVVNVKGESLGRATYTLDLTKKPRRIDVTLAKGEEKHTFTAIYELDGDTLKLCHFVGEKKGYPEKFEATKDTVLAVLKRARRD